MLQANLYAKKAQELDNFTALKRARFFSRLLPAEGCRRFVCTVVVDCVNKAEL